MVAQKIATAAITLLVDGNGIMHDPCEPHCGADGVQFKEIFARNLVELDGAYPQSAYRSFVDTNANAVWTQSQGPTSSLARFGLDPLTRVMPEVKVRLLMRSLAQPYCKSAGKFRGNNQAAHRSMCRVA